MRRLDQSIGQVAVLSRVEKKGKEWDKKADNMTDDS